MRDIYSNSKKTRKKNSPLYTILLILFAGVFLVSGVMLVRYFVNSAAENAAFAEIQKEIDAAKKGSEGTASVPGSTEEGEALARRSYLGGLYKKNNDLVGWLQIENTRVNYPVMFTPEDPEYYLRRAFDGSYAESGVLFVGPGNTMESQNIVIYGHNMNDGSMFADLLKYEDKQYFDTHKTVFFDTLEANGEYEIIAVLKTAIGGDHFNYYSAFDFADAQQFEEYQASLKAESLYDTGYSAKYGDRLITLSTCSYHVTDGRLVVIAAEKKR